MPHHESWRITVTPDAEAMSELAADAVLETIRGRPDAVITLPTGATPLHLFDILARRYADGDVDFSGVRFFSLDDYLGLTGDEPNSLTAWLRKAFLDRVNLAPENVHLAPAGAEDPVEAAAAYDRALSAYGGFDLAVVGIGGNGHVAFNEPDCAADSRTRVVDLTSETVAQASAYWNDTLPIPTRALTVGIANMLESKRIILLASGRAKAVALQRALEGPVGSEIPASFLRLAASRLEVLADADAASLLQKGIVS